MKFVFILISHLLFFLSLEGQCPDRDFLWHRIIFLRDSSSVSPKDQLKELLHYEKEIKKCSYKNDSTHTLLLQRIGWLYTTQNDFLNAINFTQNSITLIDQNNYNPGIKAVMAIKSYWNLYLMYDSLKIESKEIMACDSCITRVIRLNTSYEYALEAIKFIVPVFFSNGDYYRCIKYAELGESIFSKSGNALPGQEENSFIFFVWKINSLLSLNKTEEAAATLTSKIKAAGHKTDKSTLGTLYGLYATTQQREGKPNEAIKYFKRSFFYHKEIRFNEGCAEALNNIGYTYATLLHQEKTAKNFYEQALTYADENEEALNILDNIANLYVQTGDYDSAFYFFKKASNLLQPGYVETGLLKKDNTFLDGKMTEYITGMLLDKAAAFLKKYKTTGDNNSVEEAIKIYKAIDSYFDKVKISQYDIQSKLFWKTNNKRLYEQGIEACYLSKNIEQAFYFFEKNRSVVLNSQIALQKNMNDADLTKQAQLKMNNLRLENELKNKDSTSQDYLRIQKALFSSRMEEEALIKRINEEHLPYHQHNSDTSFITISKLRKNILSNSKTLLEIFNGDSAVYVLTITSNNQSLHKIDKNLYDSLTRNYISSISNRNILNKHFKDFINTSYRLYKLIFQDNLPGNNIIISPDGKGYPFEALVMTDNIQQPDYLLSHYVTSYTYSSNYLITQPASAASSNNNLLGIAPVNYYDNQNLSELSGSDQSLKTIGGYFNNATNYTLAKATKNNFLQSFPGYNIVQLYTHASDNSGNNDPVIYFSDSALYLSSLIPDRKPVTQLVVLSACETANGKLYEGEGIFSFNRAFAALGIPAAVSNLWSVDNRSTYSITELFYKYLSQGLPTDMALQKAKLEFINTASSEEKKLPYFWAACILTGKVDILKPHETFPWLKLAGIAFSILIATHLTKRFLRTRIRNKNTLS